MTLSEISAFHHGSLWHQNVWSAQYFDALNMPGILIIYFILCDAIFNTFPIIKLFVCKATFISRLIAPQTPTWPWLWSISTFVSCPIKTKESGEVVWSLCFFGDWYRIDLTCKIFPCGSQAINLFELYKLFSHLAKIIRLC